MTDGQGTVRQVRGIAGDKGDTGEFPDQIQIDEDDSLNPLRLFINGKYVKILIDKPDSAGKGFRRLMIENN